MSPLFDSVALWLADVHLLAGALLALVLPALLLLRQPAQRMAVAKSALAALAALVVLCALPGWSLVYLLSAEAPPARITVAVSEPFAPPFTPPVVQYDPTLVALLAPAQQPNAVASPAPAPVSETPALPTFSWPAALVVLQGIGSAAVIAWLAIGAIMVRRVRRMSQPASPELQRLLAELSRATSPPSLLVSARVSTPVALGLRRPAILLPANLVQPPALPGGSATNAQRPATPGQSPGLSEPPPPGLSAILAHEYAHVAAGDLRTLALARLLLTIFWPQPLFWLLRRRIRFDQESLADVAAAEVAGRVNYAEQLVGWARTAPPRVPRLAGAIGLWEGPSQLKRRITLLLDEQLTILRTATRRWRIGTACAALVAAALLSLVTVQRQEVARAAAEVPTRGAVSDHAVLTGRVTTSNGRPIAGVEIVLYGGFATRWKVGATTTDEGGVYKFDPCPAGAGLFDEDEKAWKNHVGIQVRHPKWASVDGECWWDVTMPKDQVTGRDFTLLPAGAVRGIVRDANGKPVPNLDLRLWDDDDGDGDYDTVKFMEYASTDDQGRFEATGLYPREYQIDVNDAKADFKRLGQVNVVGDSTTRVDLVSAATREGADAEPATITGRIVLEDGSPARTAGWLESENEFATGKGSLSSTEGQFTDTFTLKAQPGTLVLKHFAKGFAPAWAGPYQLKSGGKQDVVITLKPGFTSTLEVADDAGTLIRGAKAYAMPFIEGSGNGPLDEKDVEGGRLTFEHLANVTYSVNVRAPGYQPIRNAKVDFKANDVIRVTMTKSRLITGTIRDAEGRPAAGALLLRQALLSDAGSENTSQESAADASAIADDQGRYRLDQLEDGAQYAFIIEAADQSRSLVTDVFATDGERNFTVPARRDLRGRILGDLSGLPIRNGKPFVMVRQHFDVRRPNSRSGSYGGLFGSDPVVTPTAEGGEFAYGGLLEGEVEIIAGDERQTFKVAAEGNTDVTLQLQSSAAGAPAAAPTPTAEATPATLPITVRGRALTSDGKPLAGATIYIASVRGDTKRLAETTSNGDGAYEFRDVPLPIEPPRDNLNQPAGAFEVFGLADGRAFAFRPSKWFRPNQKHYDDRELMFMEDRPHGFGTEDPIELDLTFAEPQTLAGRLVDDAGQPIIGANLAIRYMSVIPDEGYAREDDFARMSPADECESFNERAIVPPTFKTQETDADGKFEFTALPGNVRFRMDISASGFPGRSEWAAARAGIQKYDGGMRAHVGVMNLTLRRPKDVAVQVVYDDTGEPAPKVFVEASNNEAEMWRSSDQNGIVRLQLPTGTYKVTLLQQYRTPYLRTEGELIVDDASEETPTTIRLRRAAEVEVTVKDAKTGAPIEGVGLWSRSAQGVVGRHERVGYRSWEEATRISHYEEPRTGADGAVTALFEPGDYVIGLASETFPAWHKPMHGEGKQVTCVAGLTENITLELQSAAPADDSLSHADTVAVNGDGGAGSSSSAGLSLPFLNVASGSPPAQLMVSTRDETSWARPESNVVKGRAVAPSSEPLAGIEVTLYRHANGHGGGGTPEAISVQTTGADGTFRFENVVDVTKEFPGGLPDERFLEAPVSVLTVVGRAPGRASATGGDIAVGVAKRGAVQQLILGTAATLTGRVTDRDGRPVADAVVRLGHSFGSPLGELINTARTDADGRYSIADLAPYDAEEAEKKRKIEQLVQLQRSGQDSFLAFDDSMRVQVRHPDFATRGAKIAKVPGSVDLQLAPASVIEGEVMTGDRTGIPLPAANAVVRLRRELEQENAGNQIDVTSYQSLSMRTDAAGRYRFGSLAAGSYTINAQVEGFVSNGLTGVKAGEGENASAPELVMTRGGKVRIKLVDAATNQPLMVPDGTRGYVNTNPSPQFPPSGSAVFSDSVGELQLPPGRYGFYVTIPGATQGTIYGNSVAVIREHDVVEGETLEITALVKKHTPPPIVASGTFQLTPLFDAPPAPSDDNGPVTPGLDFVPEPSLNLVPPTAPAADPGASGIPGGADRAGGAVTYHRVGDATPTTIVSNNALRAAAPLVGSAPAGGILRTLEPLYGMGAARAVKLDKPETHVNAYNAAGQPMLVRQLGGDAFLRPADGAIDPNASSPAGPRSVLDALGPASDAFRTNNPDGSAWLLVAAPAPDTGSGAAETTHNGSIIADGTFAAAPAPDADALEATASAAPKDTTALHELRVRVTDADGQPLAGAKVFQNHVHIPPDAPANNRIPSTKNLDYVTDNDGFAVLSWAGESIDLRIWVTHPGYVALHAMWAKQFQADGGTIPGEFTFVMKQGTKIGGVVRDQDGRPIARASVVVQNATAVRPAKFEPGLRPVPVPQLATGGEMPIRTDADGHWTLDNVPDDSDLQPPADIAEVEAAAFDPPLRLHVTHPDFAAFDGLKPRSPGAPSLEALRAGTAEVRLAAKPPQPAATDGAAAAVRPAEIPDWARREPNVVKGRAVDPAGQPLVGVEVALYRVVGWDGAAPEQLAVQATGPDGAFKFENVFDVANEFPQGLPDDRFVSSPIKILMVVGRGPGRETKWSNEAAYRVVREGFGTQLVMDRAAALTGRVTARDGRPVANAVVRFFQVLLPAGDLVNVTRTDADGRYAITDLAPCDAEATKRMREEQAKQNPNLASWTLVNVGMNVQVEHPDFATSIATIPAIPGTVDLELAPGSAIEGVVVIGDRTGVPLPAANVTVTLMRQMEPRVTSAQLNFQPTRTASVQTDGAGRYRFGSLAAGSYVMNAQSEGFVCHGVRDMNVGEGETVAAPELTLTRGGTVRIKLVDANTNKLMALPDGTRGYVIPHPQPPLPSPRVVTFRNAVGETQILAGRYGFIVNIPGATLTDPSWQSVKLPTTTPPEITHEVKEGETVEIEVPIKLQHQQAMATGTLQLHAPAATSSGEDDEPAEEPKAPDAPATPWGYGVDGD